MTSAEPTKKHKSMIRFKKTLSLKVVNATVTSATLKQSAPHCQCMGFCGETLVMIPKVSSIVADQFPRWLPGGTFPLVRKYSTSCP